MDVLGRVLLGLYFLIPGIMKIVGFDGMLAYMTQHSVPLTLPLLLITIVLEVGGGLALIAGWRTKTAAFMLAGLTPDSGERKAFTDLQKEVKSVGQKSRNQKLTQRALLPLKKSRLLSVMVQ